LSQTDRNETGPATRVVVVGGGLAGLTCALDLAEAGVPTTLIEKRPFVGGKTFSFTDPRNGVELDNGQHVYLRCCTAYIELLDHLGLKNAVRMQPRLRVPVLDPATGVISPIASGPAWIADRLPSRINRAPLNLATSILRFAHLGVREKLMLGCAVLPLMRMSDQSRRDLDDRSFGDWLRAHRQSSRVIDRFWDLIVLPTCNDVSDAVSAAQAAYVFKTGLLDDAHGADIGLALVGLSHLASAALERFRAAGGEVRLGLSVRGLVPRDDNIIGIQTNTAGNTATGDGTITAAAVVLALPPNRVAALLPPDWRALDGIDDSLTSLDAFSYSPIVNVHLHLDRPIGHPRPGSSSDAPSLDTDDFIAVLDPDVQFVFNRSRIRNGARNTEPDGSQWLDISLSGAHTQATKPQAAIAEEAIAGLRRAFPAARAAEVLSWRVVKELEATFRPAPGVAARRPGPTTSVPNLFLAGAWTDTQWPATMESAVRSGHAAAQALLASPALRAKS
jgi:squalene-associated FAD-dependent desaturase